MCFLVISELNDILGANNYHFSLTKGLLLAQGLTSQIKTYYLSTQPGNYQDVEFITPDQMTDEFIKTVDYVLFIRESNFHHILDQFPALKQAFNQPDKQIRFGIKGDSTCWVNDKTLKKWTKEHYNTDPRKWGYKYWDIIYCQTPEIVQDAKKLFNRDPLNKIRASRMGIPKIIPSKDQFTNPYHPNHDYCRSTFSELAPNLALLPLKFAAGFDHVATNCSKEKFHQPKTIIIYTGRIKTDGGKIVYLMRDIMEKLGDEYELHIFPGRFTIPGFDFKVFSPKNGRHLQFLRDTVFANSTNVIIHFPYRHHDRWKYLYHADIGLDFSPVRPKNIKAKPGNAKLLDYCSTGLPIVTEKNVNNSHLVEVGKNGILLDGVATADDYVQAIQQLKNTPIDREYAQKQTIESSNWEKIGQEILADFQVPDLL